MSGAFGHKASSSRATAVVQAELEEQSTPHEQVVPSRHA